MPYLKEELGWHYRIRGKNDLWVWCGGKPPRQLKQFHLGLGEAVLLQGVKITKTDPFGLVCLALARDLLSGELWYIISDETPTLQTFREYSYRFDIEENFLDDKSNGFEARTFSNPFLDCAISLVLSFISGNALLNCPGATSGCFWAASASRLPLAKRQ